MTSNRRFLLLGMVLSSAAWVALIYIEAHVGMSSKVVQLWKNDLPDAGFRATENPTRNDSEYVAGTDTKTTPELLLKLSDESSLSMWVNDSIAHEVWAPENAVSPSTDRFNVMNQNVTEQQSGLTFGENSRETELDLDALLQEVGVMNGTETNQTDLGQSSRVSSDLKITETNVLSTPDSKVRVIILASMRTGSSFVGEFFGSNSDVFYLFEPGLSVSETLARYTMTPAVQENVYLKMLEKLLLCDFESLEFYLQWLSRHPWRNLKKIAPRFYGRCSQYQRQHPRKARCPITKDMAREICEESKYIVIKSIRVPDINLLFPMIEDKNRMNLKVIHLARDPRPMIASRVRALEGKSLTRISRKAQDDLSIYCRYNWANLELGTRRPSLKYRYMFLRYEDAAMDPKTAASRIYQFLGRGGLVPDSVLKWIDSNTGSYRPGTYSTARISSQVYQKWRLTMPVSTAVDIQTIGQCEGMMRRMGYKLLVDRWHLRNLSRELVGPIPPTTDDGKYDWAWF